MLNGSNSDTVLMIALRIPRCFTSSQGVTMESVTQNPEASSRESGPYKVQVLDRAIAILDLLADSSHEMSLGELTTAIGLHKSTVHRLLMVLERHRLLHRSPLHGRYRLGMKLFELGTRAVANLNLLERARPRLEKLSAHSHLFVLDHGEMLCIEKFEPERAVRISSSAVGKRVGVHCSAAGKAVLASMPEPAVRQILQERGMAPFTLHTITSPDAFIAELDRTRARGYATDNEEVEVGVHCIAVPIFDGAGRAIAAVSVSGPTYRFNAEKSGFLVDAIRSVANELSAGLGSSRRSVAVTE
jgi:DNA-binding IclR family transcriptional regulator